jgi:hypothetical protein
MKNELSILLIDGEEQSVAPVREILAKSESPFMQVQWAGTLARAVELLEPRTTSFPSRRCAPERKSP